jgi:HD superfamily phosphohydrolase YqeK
MTLAERYKEQFPETMHILDISGVSPFGTRDMINPYTHAVDSEDFANIGRHCMAVASTAEKIAYHLLAGGSIDQNQVNDIVTAAILHDGDKRLEVMRKKAKNVGVLDAAGNPIDVYGEAGYATIATVFSNEWVDPAILTAIKNMGGMTAHNSVKKFITMQDGEVVLNRERTLAEMIVHIADDMTHSPNPDMDNPTIVTNFEERARLWKFQERYSFLWQEWLAISNDGQIRDIRDIASHDWVSEGEITLNYYDWAKLAFQLICSHIQKLVDPMSHVDPLNFVVW